MAIFEGTIQEFHHLIGPRIRNAINNFTRSYRKRLNGICENCGLEKELHSAHVHDNGRRSIIEYVLSDFDNNGVIKCDIDFAEKKILEAHQPIEKYFKFLCHSCHVEYDSKVENIPPTGINNEPAQPGNFEKLSKNHAITKQHQGNDTINIKEILMIKFYVVNGISYPAAETAVGHFGGHGYECMRVCRNVGITNAKLKGSMSLKEFIDLINSSNFIENIAGINDLDIDPLEYYLENKGFGVIADNTELFMAEQYFVNGTPYEKSEEMANLHGKKGFEAMYAVCKFGGFYGAKNKGSMNLKQFQERRITLNL
jgi:hypothetical protein